MVEQSNLKGQIVHISQDYLGPAAERFIDRQISTHLHKNSQNLTDSDLIKLIDWLKLSLALLTSDGDMVDEYERRLRSVIRQSSSKANG